jgi:hypothetical protein
MSRGNVGYTSVGTGMGYNMQFISFYSCAGCMVWPSMLVVGNMALHMHCCTI